MIDGPPLPPRTRPLPRPCPYCGALPSGEDPQGDGSSASAMSALASEIQRIRELVERRDGRATQQRIAELSREVQQLRATVARLRGSATARGYR